VIAVRTPPAKYALSTNCQPGTLEIANGDHDAELYEYSNAAGRLELDNRHGRSPHEEAVHRLLTEEVLPHELRAPLPSGLRDAYALGQDHYTRVSGTIQSQVAHDAARRRARRRTQSLDQLVPHGLPAAFGPGRRGMP
jgi:hypothetical protein